LRKSQSGNDALRCEIEDRRDRPHDLASGTLAVPNVSTATDTGCATPIAYAICTSQRWREPRATMFFATQRAA